MSHSPMELAEAFIKTGELTDAIDALNDHLQIHLADYAARRLRAAVLLRLGDPTHLKQALEDLDSLPEITSQDHVQRSIISERMGDYDNALEAMQKALLQEPEDERMAERIVGLLIEQKRYNEALEIVREQARTWRWLQWEADILVQLQDDEAAIQRYGVALAQMDGHHFLEHEPARSAIAAIRARMLLARAHAFRRAGHYEEAEEHYSMAAVYIPNDPVIPFNQGLLLALQGKKEAAAERCTKAFKSANKNLQHSMLQEIKENPSFQSLYDVLKTEINA